MRTFVVFTADGSFLSRSIRWLTRGDVSHALVLFLSKDLGGWYVMQAEAKGFVMRPAEKLRMRGWWKHAFRLVAHPEQERAFLRSLALRLQVGYDFLSIAEWAAAGLGNRIAGRDKWQPRWRNADRLYCSEAVSEAAVAVGLHGFSSDKNNPEELEQLCDASPSFERVGVDALADLVERGME